MRAEHHALTTTATGADGAGAQWASGRQTDPASPPRLRLEDVRRVAEVARREAGIEIHEGKTEFLQSRLARRLSACGLRDYGAYVRLLDEDANERRSFIEALTTHTTSFFREVEQYRWLEETGVPELFAQGVGRSRELVFWSAACSTGPEGWTALMIAERLKRTRLFALRHRLIGTDISSAVVRRAAAAVYVNEEIAGIPLDLRRMFLLRAKSGDGRCRIAPELRALAQWRIANLTEPRTLEGVTADVIFLRNVLIYFDDPTQRRVIDNVARRLRPGGFLLTGHTETANARRPGFTMLRPSIYRKDE